MPVALYTASCPQLPISARRVVASIPARAASVAASATSFIARSQLPNSIAIWICAPGSGCKSAGEIPGACRGALRRLRLPGKRQDTKRWLIRDRWALWVLIPLFGDRRLHDHANAFLGLVLGELEGVFVGTPPADDWRNVERVMSWAGWIKKELEFRFQCRGT